MNWVDIVIVVVWVATAFWGASIGLIQVAVHLVVVAVGLALSSRIAGVVGDLFAPVTDNEQAQTVAGFIAIFLILFIAGGIVSHMLRTVLGIIPLVGSANKLGALLADNFDVIIRGIKLIPSDWADEYIPLD